MVRDVKSVPVKEPVTNCLKLMSEHDIGSVVVTDGGKPVGIFTERDVLRRVASNPASLKLTVGEVMTKPVVTVSLKATIWDAITLLDRNKIRRLAVVDGTKLVGIVTERDLMRTIASQQNILLEEMAETLPAATRENIKVISFHIGVVGPR